jgi:hypothetical protein
MITLFSWGYWGWGNVTRQFVEAVDAAEASRGFAPPLFVDVLLPDQTIRGNLNSPAEDRPGRGPTISSAWR